MMNEYWINVYFDHELGTAYLSKEMADYIKDEAFNRYGWKVVYRIHVRLK